jgi:hypothetical protein
VALPNAEPDHPPARVPESLVLELPCHFPVEILALVQTQSLR